MLTQVLVHALYVNIASSRARKSNQVFNWTAQLACLRLSTQWTTCWADEDYRLGGEVACPSRLSDV